MHHSGLTRLRPRTTLTSGHNANSSITEARRAVAPATLMAGCRQHPDVPSHSARPPNIRNPPAWYNRHPQPRWHHSPNWLSGRPETPPRPQFRLLCPCAARGAAIDRARRVLANGHEYRPTGPARSRSAQGKPYWRGPHQVPNAAPVARSD